MKKILSILVVILFLLPLLVSAQTGTYGSSNTIKVTEQDGSPSINAKTLKFQNGMVTNSGGGIVTIGSDLSAWQAKTTTYTASSGDRIISDTSGGAWTLTLPATPSLGDEVDVIDGAGSWTAYNLTIGRNSTKINGAEEDLTLNVSNAHVKLVYYDATNGWRVLNW